ncbi:MAG: FecCD family ABC transporter permease [Gemmatimonadaceae bacterium]
MRGLRWIALSAGLVAAVVAGVAIGVLSYPPAIVVDALLGRGDATAVAVIWSLRLPRVILAALVGGSLGMAGAAMQGAMRNALAEPYLLGVSGGAAVGAVITQTLGAAEALVPIGAFVGAVCAVAVTLGVARAAPGRGDPGVLLIAGVIVGAFANAAIMILLAGAAPDVVRNALWWMMGSAADARWSTNASLGAYLLVGGVLLIAWARQIDILALGDDAAAGLGLDVDRASRRVYLTASLLAAASVAAAGLVGFVGLVVPHLARAAGWRTHRPLLGGSALAGALLVVVADLAARTVRAPAELPLGAVTAVIGVPFFLARLKRAA